ncbi:hypothetical protein Pme01_05930 [Planosporangium mesophilum]|uniref:Methyltransferase n=2 Tax=Planosporangium mesophilum TaxID=689768 RepID=A0A8J3T9E5_9ACTN|nr:site-specific DNA-methyltransferase [Planosporangium mesophilum]GII20996.1 hypothetical protein Pme01_05930 [Planosporangium mesophilum]
MDPIKLAKLPDIKPRSPITTLDREKYLGQPDTFPVDRVAPLVGMSPIFIRKVVGKTAPLTVDDVILLLDQDAYAETFIRRSQVLDHLFKSEGPRESALLPEPESYDIHEGNVLQVLGHLPRESVQCVVTSTPYWALRIYKESFWVQWADGESCPYGHEQTPEGFIRHTAEVLFALSRVLRSDGSIWWNVMDSFNTRTQIRGNALEALHAMQGKDKRSWSEHECRRYSAGHSYLKDGEQCLIPCQVAERASRMGLYVKSIVTWAKTGTLPEPQNSRVSRNLEYVIHLSKVRTPKFDKDAYRTLPVAMGGRDPRTELDKLSDVWTISPSVGGDGHGAQFPLALPGRCIGLTTEPNDVVLDPFAGSGNAGVAAIKLGRRFIGIDVAKDYADQARRKISRAMTAPWPVPPARPLAGRPRTPVTTTDPARPWRPA